MFQRVQFLTQWFVWKWILNFKRSLFYHLQFSNIGPAKKYVKQLKNEGILILNIEDLLDSRGLELVHEVRQFSQTELNQEYVQKALRGQNSISEGNFFLLSLLPNEFYSKDPFVLLAIHPKILAFVNQYFGMAGLLRAIRLWLNFPTDSESKETQLWHRDSDDLVNLKVFIYLNDVNQNNGPFCFIRKTHPFGSLHIKPQLNENGRVSDEEMNKCILKKDRLHCLGPEGTIIFADTCGYHKGLKPLQGHRLLLMIQYTSGRPRTGKTMRIKNIENATLSMEQKFALGVLGGEKDPDAF